MGSVVLITGATGFLGTQVARRLLAQSGLTLAVLVRAADAEDATRRLCRAWWDSPDLAEAVGSRIEVLRGDIRSPRLGLDDATYGRLVARVTHVIHAAADLRLSGPLAELWRTNVEGTAHALALARAAHADHGLQRFAYVSTAYVAGRRFGSIAEDSLSAERGFANTYELTKHHAERLVQAAKADLPVSVFRPGMIVGDSRSGAIKTFNTVYFPLRLYLTGKLRALPTRGDLRLNLVPVDYVAEAIVRLTCDGRAEGLTFHLTAPHASLPTLREVVTSVRAWSMEHLGVRLPRVAFLPVPPAAVHLAIKGLQTLTRGRSKTLNALTDLTPYMRERRRFERGNADRLLGPYTLRWQEILPTMLAYAVEKAFLHRSARTVHEQILFRLQSASRPVTYHDMAAGEVATRSGTEVRAEMLAAASALRALGIGAGDRVAVVGLNSTRYLTVDVAIGLLGAVSVPLYFTSPPAEIDEVLRASGARLLFVGAPQVLARLAELPALPPVVSFCRDLRPVDAPAGVISWQEFLALGRASGTAPWAPVTPRDLATLRYTSGTTGRPRGATFTHENLRWMGETLASMVPWRYRNRAARYLSYLPMNHVVEGILATYSPYYHPAPLHIYFLEDFHDLPWALRRARPMVFFSVPRFYEKAWELLLRSRIGRAYAGLPAGRWKRALGAALRWGFLKRAGLDRCAQLIAGSAPMSTGLLRAYRELGIEVHNAYGLTEAPLVTINPLGDNRLGTVGRPLPETEVCIAEDGEVLVRGPQVTPGYADPTAAQPFREGWLCTGDLGHLDTDGRLVIDGRKKELIVTAYGKNINPTKVEELLREIPGVAEAMLVGDDRPYCVALLWAGDKTDGSHDETDRAVRRVNERLSHPEQVRRWAILPNELSVERGDLTANLKLRRPVIACRHAALLQGLYAESPRACEAACHVGQASREEVPA